ncbi:MAG: HU family DNA-binding protein, partial [Bacteroidota bacterium]
MNKTELIDAMAADAGITKAAAKKALESFLGNVEGSLKGGPQRRPPSGPVHETG